MIAYREFVDGVRKKAELADAEEARRATIDVVAALVQHLDGADREQLATVLPGKLREDVPWDAPLRSGDQPADLAQEVGGQAGAPPERARYLTQAVLSQLAAQDPDVAKSLQHRLPGDLGVLFAPPGGGPPPEWAAAGADERPRPLDQGELERTLRSLPGWTGTTTGISREVSLPADRLTPLLNQVKQAEKDLSHHAGIEERSSGVLFTLRTRSLDAVTELDVELARRIDEAVGAVGSGG
ncbi:MAG: DUF2267 domain-containing protein [Saccharopolyspora sp.]|uniref:DUF2267 domain-containing protein n=1 Tax=Saccharopolyspora sp. TaxID=33915 RepID=UPI0026009E47|nr:DUF2267 domain-containing protein [Saccharopolyspora sp.]MBQ6642235.1 DUF2267 domain-containing protein [Saccharopolyspora sp.]